MKLSVVGPAYPLRGGIAHHVFWLERELTARGHTVQVISFRQLYPRLFFPGTTESDNSRLAFDAGAVPILKPLDPRTWRRASEMIKSFAPTAVLFQWWQPFFGPLVGRIARTIRDAGIRSVVECHNVFPHEGSPIDRILLRYGLSPASLFITHSKRDEQDLLKLLPEARTRVSPLPVLEQFITPATSDRSGRTILFFGKVRKYKGLELLLAAMPRVLARVDCELIVAGEFYTPIERYRRLIDQLDIARSVRLIDRYIPNEEVPALFTQADVLVLPYFSASQSAVARIATSNALPIIATRVGGFEESIREQFDGLLVPPADPDALADALIDYFINNRGPIFAGNIRAASGISCECRIIEILEELEEKEPAI